MKQKANVVKALKYLQIQENIVHSHLTNPSINKENNEIKYGMVLKETNTNSTQQRHERFILAQLGLGFLSDLV